MEKHTSRESRWVRALFVFCICLCLIAFSIIPTQAAEEDGYGICIDLIFSDRDEVSHSLEDYQANAFLLQDHNGLYMTAEYITECGGFIVTGTTPHKSNATRLCFGSRIENPEQLHILGLDAGNYLLTMTQITDNYTCLDDLAVTIFANTATVVGHEVTMDNMQVPISIIVTRPFHIPPCSCEECQRSRLVSNFLISAAPVFVVLGLALIFWQVRKSRK